MLMIGCNNYKETNEPVTTEHIVETTVTQVQEETTTSVVEIGTTKKFKGVTIGKDGNRTPSDGVSNIYD